jgi:hypothetical protein
MRSRELRRINLGLFGVAMIALILIVAGLMLSPPVVEAQGPGKAPVLCTASVPVTGSTAVTTELVALAAGKRVYVCGFVLNGAGAATVTLKYGTGTACATGTASLTGAMKLIDGSTIAVGTGAGMITKTPVSQSLCWTNSAAVQVSGVLSYAQY